MKIQSLIKDEKILNRLIQEGKMPFLLISGHKVSTEGKIVKNGVLLDNYEEKETQPVEPKKEPKTKVKNENTKSRK